MAKKKSTKIIISETANPPVGVSVNQLQRYQERQELFQAQPAIVQRFLDAQARQASDAIMNRLPQIKFTLPDRVVVDPSSKRTETVPGEYREQMAGGLMDRLTRSDNRDVLRHRLLEMEQDENEAVAASAVLMRHAIVMYMVHGLLPSGKSVTYVPADGEEIPTVPVSDEMEPESAITAATDAIAEEGKNETGRGELLVPYVPAARRFYLPQWVAFDNEGNLLMNSVNQAEAHLASMQRFLWVLHSAVSLAPYIVADEEYQRKRYGMLGQLVNQGRALARYETNEIIQTIKRRAMASDLNRGLSLSLPYFDDQELELRTHDFEIIPGGRIMFIPAFVVVAAREEQAKVAQDTRMSQSTKKHLLEELERLEKAFESDQRWKL